VYHRIELTQALGSRRNERDHVRHGRGSRRYSFKKQKNQPPRSSYREPTSGRWHLGRRHMRGIVASLAKDLFNVLQVEQNNKLCVERRPPFECAASLLQGGGALGAYQAGVYEALSESGIHPDWVAGISIGAINSALIVGKPAGKAR
jgi:predicted acylesterase/phospholipase RssA